MLSHNDLGLWKEDVASKSYRSGHKGTVFATYNYHSGNILAIIAAKSYCPERETKVIMCNAVTF